MYAASKKSAPEATVPAETKVKFAIVRKSKVAKRAAKAVSESEDSFEKDEELQ